MFCRAVSKGLWLLAKCGDRFGLMDGSCICPGGNSKLAMVDTFTTADLEAFLPVVPSYLASYDGVGTGAVKDY